MRVSYYPGCTLKTKAANLDRSSVESLGALGIELKELPRWNCCGAVYSLADDDLLHMLAPVRDLIRVKEQGDDKMLTACSMCYNTLARANLLMREDEEKRNTLNAFMEEEPDYGGEVDVLHILPFLRDQVGWDALKKKVKVPLEGLKVATYYGCTLLRPRKWPSKTPMNPTLLAEFLEALGAEVPVRFASQSDCCSSYQMVSNPDAAYEGSFHDSRFCPTGRSRGADLELSALRVQSREAATRHRQEARRVQPDPHVLLHPAVGRCPRAGRGGRAASN